jgi:hypothetical protein
VTVNALAQKKLVLSGGPEEENGNDCNDVDCSSVTYGDRITK